MIALPEPRPQSRHELVSTIVYISLDVDSGQQLHPGSLADLQVLQHVPSHPSWGWTQQEQEGAEPVYQGPCHLEIGPAGTAGCYHGNAHKRTPTLESAELAKCCSTCLSNYLSQRKHRDAGTLL